MMFLYNTTPDTYHGWTSSWGSLSALDLWSHSWSLWLQRDFWILIQEPTMIKVEVTRSAPSQCFAFIKGKRFHCDNLEAVDQIRIQTVCKERNFSFFTWTELSGGKRQPSSLPVRGHPRSRDHWCWWTYLQFASASWHGMALFWQLLWKRKSRLYSSLLRKLGAVSKDSSPHLKHPIMYAAPKPYPCSWL